MKKIIVIFLVIVGILLLSQLIPRNGFYYRETTAFIDQNKKELTTIFNQSFVLALSCQKERILQQRQLCQQKISKDIHTALPQL